MIFKKKTEYEPTDTRPKTAKAKKNNFWKNLFGNKVTAMQKNN